MSTLRGENAGSDVPRSLTAELIQVLGLLDRAPEGIAEATLALLPYGSRLNLAAHGFIEELDGGREDAVEIRITQAGWDVIRACAGTQLRPPRERARDIRTPRSLEQFITALERQLPTANLGQLSARLHHGD